MHVPHGRILLKRYTKYLQPTFTNNHRQRRRKWPGYLAANDHLSRLFIVKFHAICFRPVDNIVCFHIRGVTIITIRCAAILLWISNYIYCSLSYKYLKPTMSIQCQQPYLMFTCAFIQDSYFANHANIAQNKVEV
jgi:hypothetical protein